MCIFTDILLKFFKKDTTTEQPQEEERKMLFTEDQLYQINGNINLNECDYYYEALNTVLPLYDINTNLRIAHFLAQVIHESGHFKYKSENLNYSAKALRSVFGKYFPNDTIANEYARKPEKIANKVYANRMGNGPESSGEGWAYRGRGLIQITGKCNYTDCGNFLKIDLVNEPDLICTYPIINIKSACWFWTKNKLNALADQDNITAITKKINGGLTGYDERCKNLDIAKKVLN